MRIIAKEEDNGDIFKQYKIFLRTPLICLSTFVSIFYEIPLTLVLRRRNGGYEQYKGIVNDSCCVIIIAVVTDLTGRDQTLLM